MAAIDETHDIRRHSWVASANGHSEFPIQNLPLGVFSPAGGPPRGGIAIGDMIFDIAAALEAGLFAGEARSAAEAAAGAALNPLMALGAGPRAALRKRPSARSEQPVKSELQVCAGRLSQPGLVGSPLGCTGAPPLRPAQATRRPGA